MSELLSRLAEQAKLPPTEQKAGADKTGFFATTVGPRTAQPAAQKVDALDTDQSTESEHEEQVSPQASGDYDPEQLTPELRAYHDRIAAKERELRDEERRLRGSFHGAGQIDNQTVWKAQQFDAMQAQKTPEPQKLDPEIEEALNSLTPTNRKVIEYLGREALKSDPAIRAALEKVEKVESQFTQRTQAELGAQVDALLKIVPREKITPKIQAQMEAMIQNPAFAGEDVISIYERAARTTVNRGQGKKSLPPQTRDAVAPSARTTTNEKRRTRDINEAVSRIAARVNQG